MQAAAERRGRRSPARDRDPHEPHSIHMPSPSYWPFVLALGLPIIGLRLRVQDTGGCSRSAALIVVLFGLNAWAIEPATDGRRRTTDGARADSSTSRRPSRRPAPVPSTPDDGHGHDATPASATTSSRSGCSSRPRPVLRRVHRDVLPLPRPRRAVPEGPDARRAAQHPVHVGDVVHPADELAHDGARARRDPARRPPPVAASGSSPPRCSALTFIGGQVYEFTEFYREGLHLGTNLFGTTFFVLTGLHGAHVTIGIIWLLSLWGRSMQGRLTRSDSEAVEIAGLYWHFVDVVWIFIFTAVYLIPPALSQGDRVGDERSRQPPSHRGPGTAVERAAADELELSPRDVVPAPGLLPGEVSPHPSPRQYVLIAVVLVRRHRGRDRDLVPRQATSPNPHHHRCCSRWRPSSSSSSPPGTCT